MIIKREISSDISISSKKKVILITGPRQTGKTTLSKDIGSSFEYLNYDRLADRKKIIAETWDREKEFLILDEIHKMKKWKLWLKGLYDTSKEQKIIVTGSSRLDTNRKVGDSMAGRYFAYQLFPFDLKELRQNNYGNTDDNFSRLISYSGFPEPFLENSQNFYKKWRKTHLDVIIKEDIISTETIKRINDLEMLVELMKSRIGSIFSYSSLREDLQTDDKTIKRWMKTLENSYLFFKITPYSKNIKDTIKKSPKYYFYDVPRVTDEGARLENFVALSLYKEIMLRNDTKGDDYSLHFLRNKQKKEIDFLICLNKQPIVMIEVKTSDEVPSPHFNAFLPQLTKANPKVMQVQLVLNLEKEFSTKEGLKVKKLKTWLEQMPF